jgi:two-component system, response regulator PdtaR
MLNSAIILVVEDHPIIRMNALDLVTTAGFEGICAANSDEAIAILEDRPDIRLVFTDVEMPGTMDGLKLVHYIRGRWPKVHLIVASGTSIIAENQLPPGTKFFSKPYGEHSIVEVMTKMLLSSDGERMEA